MQASRMYEVCLPGCSNQQQAAHWSQASACSRVEATGTGMDLADVVAVQLKMAVGRAASPAASAPSPTSTSYVDTAAVPTVTLETNMMGEPRLSHAAWPSRKLSEACVICSMASQAWSVFLHS